MATLKVELTLNEAQQLDEFVCDVLGFLTNMEGKHGSEHQFSSDELAAFNALIDRRATLLKILTDIPIKRR